MEYQSEVVTSPDHYVFKWRAEDGWELVLVDKLSTHVSRYGDGEFFNTEYRIIWRKVAR